MLKKWWDALVKKIKELLAEKVDEVTPKPAEPTPEQAAQDEAKLFASVKWLGRNLSGCTTVVQLIKSATLSGGMMRTSYDPYSWPSNGGCDAMCCIIYQKNGQWVGGVFDYWRNGGQGAKTAENIRDGYCGLEMPQPDWPTKTFIVSIKENTQGQPGPMRSNLCDVKRG